MFGRTTAVLVGAFVLATPAADAQVRASERALIQQTVDGTVITVEYYRSRVPGRTVFSGIVPSGDSWRPSANWATRLKIDKDIRLEQHLLPKGDYWVWMIPQPDEWAVVISRSSKVFRTFPPKPESEALRFTVKPETAPHTEALTWSVREVESDRLTLRFQWAELAIPFRIVVTPILQGPQSRSDELPRTNGNPYP